MILKPSLPAFDELLWLRSNHLPHFSREADNPASFDEEKMRRR